MHASRLLAPAALLVILTFAGCVERPTALVDEEGLPMTRPPEPANADASTAPGDRPSWTHGDWFEFEVHVDNTYVQFETRDRVVVHRADASGYDLAAGNRDLGVIDTHFDDFFVGSLDIDLNAVLGTDQAQFRMFEWPLAAGKSWDSPLPTDPFTGQTDTVTLTVIPLPKVEDPRGDAEGFAIEGVSTLGYTFHYVYSSRVDWITEFTKTAPDGRVALSLELRDWGKNYEGVLHLVTKKTLYERVIIWPFFVFAPELAPVPPVDLVTVNEEFTFVQEVVAAFTFDVPANGSQPAIPGAGSFHVQIKRADDPPRHVSHIGTGNSGKIEIVDLEPYAKGTYAASYCGSGIGGMYVAYHGFDDAIVEFGAESHEGHNMG